MPRFSIRAMTVIIAAVAVGFAYPLIRLGPAETGTGLLKRGRS
jgi:hypothetical protein